MKDDLTRKARKQALRDFDGEFAGTIDNRLLCRCPIAGDRHFRFATELGDLLGRLRDQVLPFSTRRILRLRHQPLPLRGNLRARLIGVGTMYRRPVGGREPRRSRAYSPPAAV